MVNRVNSRGRSITGGLFVIAIGVFLLMFSLHPDWDMWPIVSRYWPVILIVLGLGKIFDAFQMRNNGADGSVASNVGAGSAVIAVIGILVLVAMFHGGRVVRQEESQAVELQGAKSVTASVDLPSGTLDVAGGAPRLLDAKLKYRDRDGVPQVNYAVANGEGTLDINQDSPSHTHLAGAGNDWQLRFADTVPLHLDVNIGAGKGDLRLNGMDVSDLNIKLGAGQLNLDLSGPRKSDLHVDVQAGVGSGVIRLPKELGARVHASGGIGSVRAKGMHEDGDDYVNDLVGKTPVTVYVTINGGVGHITLEER
jgi:cell wall-active antibiotic response 4TMS protein YvqF/uncharacterized protein DUF2154